MGLTLFLLRDYTSASDESEDKKRLFKSNINAYLLCLKNRKIVLTSLVLMVGAAGRGTGVNATISCRFSWRDSTLPHRGRNAFNNMMGCWAHRSPSHRLALGPQRQTHRHHPSDARVIGNHDRLVAQQTPMGLLFYLNLILYGAVVVKRAARSHKP